MAAAETASPSAPPAGPSRAARWWALATVLAALVLWAPGLGNGPVIDDNINVFKNPYMQDWSGLAILLTSTDGNSPHRYYPTWRPLRLLTHRVDMALFGPVPAAHRAVNLLLHAACTLLLLVLGRRLGLAAWAAGLGAILFAVHPVQSEVVLWIKERDSLLCMALLLGALLCALRRGWASAAAGVLLFALSLLSKESGVVFLALAPAVLAVDHLRGNPVPRRRAVVLLAASLAAFALFWWARGLVLPMAAQVSSPIGGTMARTLWMMNEVLLRYVGLVLWPENLFLTWDFISPDERAWMKWAGLATWLAMVAGAWVVRRRSPAMALGLAWFLVALAPVSNLIPMMQWMAVRFLYVPMAGAGLALGAGLELAHACLAARGRMPKSVLLRPAAGAALLLAVLAIVSLHQIPHWRDEATLMARDWDAGNRTERSRWEKAGALLKQGRVDEAIALTDGHRAPGSRFPHATALQVAAFIEAQASGAEAGYQVLAQSVERFADDPMLRHFRATLAIETGRHKEAEDLLLGLRDVPGMEHAAWSMLGVLYGVQGQGQRATDAFAEARKHQPLMVDAPR